MKEIGVEELKILQLDILKKIADYCELNNLTYFLAYGTLLGAVRHKGYIPWDDDVDIMMPRKDYNIFLEHFNGKVPNLVVVAPELNLEYYAPYANVYDDRTILDEDIVSHKRCPIGIKIDVFPLDNIPSDKELYKELRRKSAYDTVRLSTKTRKLSFYHGMERIKLAINKARFSFESIKKIQKRHLELINDEKYNSDGDSIDVTVVNSRDVCAPKKMFFPASKLMFEGLEFSVPNDYDGWLRLNYGDYMQLPPENERIAKHFFKAYWK